MLPLPAVGLHCLLALPAVRYFQRVPRLHPVFRLLCYHALKFVRYLQRFPSSIPPSDSIASDRLGSISALIGAALPGLDGADAEVHRRGALAVSKWVFQDFGFKGEVALQATWIPPFLPTEQRGFTKNIILGCNYAFLADGNLRAQVAKKKVCAGVSPWPQVGSQFGIRVVERCSSSDGSCR